METKSAESRTPLWRMTDEQLRAYAEDDLVDWSKRKTAEMILINRAEQNNNEVAFAAKTSEV